MDMVTAVLSPPAMVALNAPDRLCLCAYYGLFVVIFTWAWSRYTGYSQSAGICGAGVSSAEVLFS